MLIDPVSAGIVAVVFAAGVVAGRRGRQIRPADRPTKPIRACKHHYGEHDEQDGCVAKIEQSRYDPHNGNHRGYDWVQCPCLRYTGPLPITSYLPPSILDDGGQ